MAKCKDMQHVSARYLKSIHKYNPFKRLGTKYKNYSRYRKNLVKELFKPYKFD